MAVSRQRAHSVATLWGQAGARDNHEWRWGGVGSLERRRHEEGLGKREGCSRELAHPALAATLHSSHALCDNHSSVLV